MRSSTLAPRSISSPFCVENKPVQRVEQCRSIGQMLATLAANEAEPVAVRGAVGDARVRAALGELLLGQANYRGAVSVHLEFPANQPGIGEPLPEFGDDFGSGHQFGQQCAL